MDYQTWWLATGWTVATVFAGGLAFLFWLLVREVGGGMRLLNENKEMRREADRLGASLKESEREHGILRIYQGQLLRQIAGLGKELKEERSSLEATRNAAREIVADREKAMQSMREENQTLRRLLTQMADGARKAMSDLSPSDELLAILSKIEDEGGDS